jgi:hypothetical protein
MQPALDLSQRHWTKTRHGITAIGTWIRLEGISRPCMVLIRAGSEYDDRTVPCVITVDRAFEWEPQTADFAQTILRAIGFCEALRLSLDKHNVVRLMNFVNDHLSDLLSIPPFPVSQLDIPVVAEITLVDTKTGRTIEKEMKDV